MVDYELERRLRTLESEMMELKECRIFKLECRVKELEGGSK